MLEYSNMLMRMPRAPPRCGAGIGIGPTVLLAMEWVLRAVYGRAASCQ
jgi:hypothetical protein